MSRIRIRFPKNQRICDTQGTLKNSKKKVLKISKQKK